MEREEGGRGREGGSGEGRRDVREGVRGGKGGSGNEEGEGGGGRGQVEGKWKREKMGLRDILCEDDLGL